ncbi:integrator complex subunit 6 homolog isoform X3 [Drosophila montana]
MSSTLVKSVKGDSLNRNNITPDDATAVSECATLPTTPVAAISPNLNSPLSELAPSTPSTTAMASPIVVTTVEILDLHNILNPDDLPKVPSIGETDLSTSAVVLNSSAGTTASITTNSSPLANRKAHNQAAANNSSPHKSRYRNHNNNQDDINSIESISSFNRNQVNTNFEWIDEMVQQRNCSELMHKNKRKKSKKMIDAKESDQLDGRKIKEKQGMAPYEDNDEKVVKCLYYSLMCCDCTIS